jgi:alpha-D-ribose 1-methylphosphonate 5-triphosphate synthase subunit PhnL
MLKRFAGGSIIIDHNRSVRRIVDNQCPFMFTIRRGTIGTVRSYFRSFNVCQLVTQCLISRSLCSADSIRLWNDPFDASGSLAI